MYVYVYVLKEKMVKECFRGKPHIDDSETRRFKYIEHS